jgi:hypothetical protein
MKCWEFTALRWLAGSLNRIHSRTYPQHWINKSPADFRLVIPSPQLVDQKGSWTPAPHRNVDGEFLGVTERGMSPIMLVGIQILLVE